MNSSVLAPCDRTHYGFKNIAQWVRAGFPIYAGVGGANLHCLNWTSGESLQDFEPMNIRRDHVELLTVDYTGPEPEVLYVVATPSGYFILGQYLSFPGTRRGKRSSLFARQVLNHGHTSIRDYLGYGSIDHLFSMTLYGQIEKGNFRSHRAHAFEFIPEFIPTQLVVLGFILEHRGPEHLEPEHDKVNFFCEQPGVSKEFLPGQVSEGGLGSRPTIRYFVCTSPLFLALRLPGSAPVVTLSYLDAGLEPIAGFLIHLGAYQLRSRQLSSFRFFCISPKHAQFARAKGPLRSVVKKPLDSDGSAAPPIFRVAREVRKLPVRTAGIEAFEFINEAERRFRGERFVGLHRAWNSGEPNELDFRREFCLIKADRAERRIWGKSLASRGKKS